MSNNATTQLYGDVGNTKSPKRRQQAFVIQMIVAITVLAAVATTGIYFFSANQYATVLEELKAKENKETLVESQKAENALVQIYQNIRTLSFLPDVQTMDRHAENMTASSRATIQQVYNNLWSNVTVSEIYFVPESFDPEKMDPATGELEVPALMYDEMITGREEGAETGASSASEMVTEQPELETEEYPVIKDQIRYFRQNFPTAKSFTGLNVPFISGPIVMTCDNTDFNKTLVEMDRDGLLLSVPYYAPTGEFKGVVTAVVRLRVLEKYLSESNVALVHVKNKTIINAVNPGQAAQSQDYVAKGIADPSLDYSEAMTLNLPDPQGAWMFWRGVPNSYFNDSAEFKGIHSQATFCLRFGRLSDALVYCARVLCCALLYQAGQRHHRCPDQTLPMAVSTQKCLWPIERISLAISAGLWKFSKTIRWHCGRLKKSAQANFWMKWQSGKRGKPSVPSMRHRPWLSWNNWAQGCSDWQTATSA